MCIIKELIFYLFVASLLFSLCDEATVTEDGVYENPAVGIRFTIHEDWSELEDFELEGIPAMEQNAIINLMDSGREAAFTVIRVPLGPMAGQIRNLDEQTLQMQLAMMVEQIDRTGETRFENYSKVSSGTADLSGSKMAKIIYIGQSDQKGLMWYRILIGVNPIDRGKLVMLIMTAPAGYEDLFEEDFQAMTNSWEWFE